MNPVPRTPIPLAAAAEQFAQAHDSDPGQTASGITAAQFIDLLGLATAVRDAEEAKENAENAYRASVAAAKTAQGALVHVFRALRSHAHRNTNMTDALRLQAGIGTPDAGGPGKLPLIEDLTAIRHSTGKIVLDWSGPTATSLRYEVFAREDGAGWVLVGSASATSFTHQDAPLTGRRDYRVVPLRGSRRGDPSNMASLDL